MSDKGAEDTLYEGLEAASTKIAARGPLSSGAISLHEEVARLQKRVEQLEAENERLKRNMGILYRTAIAEIQRREILQENTF